MQNKIKIVFLDAGTIGKDIKWPNFEEFGEFVTYFNSTPTETMQRIIEADIVLTNKAIINYGHLRAAKKLKLICSVATGYNQIDVESATRAKITVCNVADYSSHSVAQHVFALILAFTNQAAEHAQAVKEGEWEQCGLFSFWHKSIPDLMGKTIGLVGFGNIGQRVAQIASAFGLRVLAYTPRPAKYSNNQNASFVSLNEIFTESDYISLHCPLTEANKDLINADILKMMKPQAVLINTARGPLINEDDLYNALYNKEIGGAGLDVLSVEPASANNRFLSLPNCIVTPHQAWASVESRMRLMHTVYANIKSFLEVSPINVVNNIE